MDPTAPSSTTDSGHATGLSVLQWTRVLQFVKTHGLTGMILILLAWNLGLLETVRATGCGI